MQPVQGGVRWLLLVLLPQRADAALGGFKEKLEETWGSHPSQAGCEETDPALRRRAPQTWLCRGLLLQENPGSNPGSGTSQGLTAGTVA